MSAHFSRLAVILAGVFASGLVCGCGTQDYEARLAESKKYFEYRQGVDAVLETQWWQAGAFGLHFRPPKDFVEIAPPALEEDPDLRQPTFLPRALPGLVGAWEATVPVETEGSDVTEQRAWIFICTNHDDHVKRFDDALIEPDRFTRRLNEDIAFSLRYDAPTEDEPWPFEEERTPAGTPYVPRKNYVAIKLEDRINIEGSGEVSMEFQLNQYSAGPIQMTLIAAYPVDIDSSFRLDHRIKTAMETLRLTEDVPGKATGQEVSGGGF